jgi:putative addiction module component (TIGR02574 family)
MSSESTSFLDAALQLPVEERAQLAFQLLQSLQTADVRAEDDLNFASELERRSHEFEINPSCASDWEDVAGRLRDTLDGKNR